LACIHAAGSINNESAFGEGAATSEEVGCGVEGTVATLLVVDCAVVNANGGGGVAGGCG